MAEPNGVRAEEREAALSLLRWYVEMGAGDAIAHDPTNRFAGAASASTMAAAMNSPVLHPRMIPVAEPPAAAREVTTAPPAAFVDSPAESAQSARLTAARVDTLAALEAAIAAFEGCSLKHTATNTVIADGNPA